MKRLLEAQFQEGISVCLSGRRGPKEDVVLYSVDLVLTNSDVGKVESGRTMHEFWQLNGSGFKNSVIALENDKNITQYHSSLII